MNIIDVWLNVSKKIKFFTKETRHQIPEKSGIYAWFMPLWLFKDDISELIDLFNKLLLYDSNCEGQPQKTVQAKFNWNRIDVQLKKVYNRAFNFESVSQKKWNEIISDGPSREAISQTLMEASIFMPPLYVGKTNNLKNRYFQHVKGSPYKKNDFHTRFTQHAEKISDEFPIMISDLLFACIMTDSKSSKILQSEEINTFIETIMLKLCKPIFSKR